MRGWGVRWRPQLAPRRTRASLTSVSATGLRDLPTSLTGCSITPTMGASKKRALPGSGVPLRLGSRTEVFLDLAGTCVAACGKGAAVFCWARRASGWHYWRQLQGSRRDGIERYY